MSDQRSPYSAAEQGLGYIYQARFALWKILSLPESSSIHIENEDDVEFTTEAGQTSLGSLKHKAPGDRLTNLSTDFWKSVRIWLAYYVRSGRRTSDSRFFLFTTADVSTDSMLQKFTEEQVDVGARSMAAASALATSTSALVVAIRDELKELNGEEAEDFYNRITIFPAGPRITQVPTLILDQSFRTVQRELRLAVYERLEGWWFDLVIKMLAGERAGPVFGYEVSDKLAALADEYKTDNLPITFRNKLPSGLDAENDNRLFVRQLRALKLPAGRIQSAIVDYYRAFEQRSSWARALLALHRFASANKEPIPRFLMIDQPTQVYFPSETVYAAAGGSVEKTEAADADLEAVRRLFEVLVNFCTDDAPGFQLIVTEHANLRDPWFQDALVEQPWTKPPALVPEGWPEPLSDEA